MQRGRAEIGIQTLVEGQWVALKQAVNATLVALVHFRICRALDAEA